MFESVAAVGGAVVTGEMRNGCLPLCTIAPVGCAKPLRPQKSSGITHSDTHPDPEQSAGKASIPFGLELTNISSFPLGPAITPREKKGGVRETGRLVSQEVRVHESGTKVICSREETNVPP
jgi:hypothetical protein